MNLLANPWVLWESGSFAHKRLLLRLVIPTPIPFSREQGFSNPELSLPFKILRGADMQNLQMVRSRGLEPPRIAPQRPQRCASTSSATTAHRPIASSEETGFRHSSEDFAQEPQRIAKLPSRCEAKNLGIRCGPCAIQPWRCRSPKIGVCPRKNWTTDAPCGGRWRHPVRWTYDSRAGPYLDAMAKMESHVAEMHSRAPHKSEWFWLVEHPPLYTAGHQRKGPPICATPGRYAGLQDQARGAVYVSWAGAAGGLCHA